MRPRAEELVRSVVEAWNRGDVETVLGSFHPDVEISSALARDLQGVQLYRGLDGGRQWSSSINESLQFTIEPRGYVDLGALVLVLADVTGRPLSGGPEARGEWGGIFITEGDKVTRLETHLSFAAALSSAAQWLESNSPGTGR
jgi:hypothetical protein